MDGVIGKLNELFSAWHSAVIIKRHSASGIDFTDGLLAFEFFMSIFAMTRKPCYI